MAKQFSELSEKLQQFVQAQKIYFVATAVETGRINLSPKGMDSLRVIDKNRLVWLNVTGSGNETAAHVQENSRMTIMFAAFDGSPMILRIYGSARVIHTGDPEWNSLYSLFKPLPGARQIFDLSIELVQTSCGMSVPLFQHIEEREQLNEWALKKGEEGLKEYWREKNKFSLDGKPTYFLKT